MHARFELTVSDSDSDRDDTTYIYMNTSMLVQLDALIDVEWETSNHYQPVHHDDITVTCSLNNGQPSDNTEWVYTVMITPALEDGTTRKEFTTKSITASFQIDAFNVLPDHTYVQYIIFSFFLQLSNQMRRGILKDLCFLCFY